MAPDDEDVVVVSGLRCSSAARMFGEMAGQVSLVDLVVIGDDLVRRRRATRPQLLDSAQRVPGRHSAVARRAAALVREGVDSPMETRVRMLIVLAGLPEPVVNHAIYREDRSIRFRFDMCCPELRLIVEYDGRQHRNDLDKCDGDITRREWLAANGCALITLVARDVYGRPEATLQRLLEALKRAGCRRLPTPLSDEWREGFPAAA